MTGEGSPRRSSLCAAAALVALALPAAGADLPRGPGREQVERYCVQCHGIATVLRGGYSRAAWRNNVQMMVNVGARVPKDEVEALVDYLASNLPERARPGPALLAGAAKAVFHEWEVPTPGTRPHDPYAAPDGALWYTGQFANVLGRRDPKTGTIREFPLTTPESGPHGLTMDRDGNVWFTANFKGYIGKLDPRTGAITEYPMPDPAARDPHTPVFDGAGILWFTVQSGNFVGRLDPATGRGEAGAPAYAARPSLRHRGEREGHPVLRGVRRQQGGPHRPAHDADRRVPAAGCALAPAAHRDHERRRACGSPTTRSGASAGSIPRAAA